MDKNMLTSKEVMDRAGISRATLNNYIAVGILPRPLVAPAEGKGRSAPRIGYFAADVLDVITEVDTLKRKGYRMTKIAEILGHQQVDSLQGTATDTLVGEAQPYKPQGDAVGNATMAARSSQATPDPETNYSAYARSSSPEPDTHPSHEGGSVTRSAGPAPMDPPIGGKKSYKQIDLNGPLKLTVENLTHPAYLVNRQFEVEWCNTEAVNDILGIQEDTALNITDRGIFRLLLRNGPFQEIEGGEEILRFHVAVAKNFIDYENLMAHAGGDNKRMLSFVLRTFEEVDPAQAGNGVLSTEANLARPGEPARWCRLYAAFFREGIFFTYAPMTEDQDSLLALLARRDLVIRDLLRKRRPYLTRLAVLVADLQNSVKICAELPPEEYFNLINEIWTTMEPLLRRYYATHGKHVGDGMLYYFLPQPDSNYVYNALRCAVDMRVKMREICEKWNSRKNWVNDLKINIGIDEGQEWFGTYQTPTHIEFTALGDTINNAGRLSDFAHDGSIWVTKSLLGNLSIEEQNTVTYGVRRVSASGEEVMVRSTFARIGSLTDAKGMAYHKLDEIAALPITEVQSIVSPV